jgi:hypothetical protein
MALTKTLTLANNFGENSEFADAYIRVDRVEATRHLVSANLGYYKEGGQEFLTGTSVSFEPDLDGSNFIKQAYEHLKTLPEFEGAEDC